MPQANRGETRKGCKKDRGDSRWEGSGAVAGQDNWQKQERVCQKNIWWGRGGEGKFGCEKKGEVVPRQNGIRKFKKFRRFINVRLGERISLKRRK